MNDEPSPRGGERRARRAGLLRSLDPTLLYAALGTVVRMTANLAVLPILTRRLSSAELSFWWMMIALGGLANLADFGFGQAISRVYSFLWAGAKGYEPQLAPQAASGAEPNLPGLARLNHTAGKLYWTLSAGALLVVGVIGTSFLSGSDTSSVRGSMVWWSWLGVLVACGYALGVSHWNLACQGINRVREAQASALLASLAYLAAVAGFLSAGFGLFALPLAIAARGVVLHLLCRSAYRRAVPRVGPASSDPTGVSKIWPNAWRFGVLSLGSYLVSNASVLVSGRVLDTSTTASFGLTAQVANLVVSVSALWLIVKWPQIAILRTQDRLEEMAVMFARRLALSVLSFVCLSAAAILLGPMVLAWNGTRTNLLSLPHLVLYFAYIGHQMVYVQFAMLAYTRNEVPFYRISVFTGLGIVVASTVLAHRYGLWGLLIAPVLATAACSSWYPVWYGFRTQPLRPLRFLKAALTGTA